MKAVQPQRGDEPVNVSLVRFYRIVTVGRPIAVAVAPLVQRQDVVMLGEGKAHKIPAVGLLRPTVQHHHQRVARAAPFQVMEVHAIDRYLMIGGLVFQGKRHPFLTSGLVQRQPQGMRSHATTSGKCRIPIGEYQPMITPMSITGPSNYSPYPG